MLFDSRKRHKDQGGVTPPRDPAGIETGRLRRLKWEAWRRSAQKVTRAWNEWLAASRRERAEFYGRYLSALAEEERAAIDLQRAVLGANLDTRAIASSPLLKDDDGGHIDRAAASG
jgi:hypothetical protein